MESIFGLLPCTTPSPNVRNPILLTKDLVQRAIERICLRLLDVVSVVLFYLGEIGDEICFVGTDPFGFLDELPAEEEDGEEEDHEVSRYVSQKSKFRGNGEAYENRNEGTSHWPFRKTV